MSSSFRTLIVAIILPACASTILPAQTPRFPNHVPPKGHLKLRQVSESTPIFPATHICPGIVGGGPACSTPA